MTTGPIRERAIIGDAATTRTCWSPSCTSLSFASTTRSSTRSATSAASKRFLRARRLTRWHYQWLIVHDYLAKSAIRQSWPGGQRPGGAALPRVLRPSPAKAPKLPMPIEFSVAAYRFGHSMVGRATTTTASSAPRPPGTPGIRRRALRLALRFHRQRPDDAIRRTNSTGQLPLNWVIEWDRFIGVDTPFHSARKIDTQFAPPLRDMQNEGGANRAISSGTWPGATCGAATS